MRTRSPGDRRPCSLTSRTVPGLRPPLLARAQRRRANCARWAQLVGVDGDSRGYSPRNPLTFHGSLRSAEMRRISSPVGPFRRGGRGRRCVCTARAELVETGERLGFAVDVEDLDARHATIGPKNEEREARYLPGAAVGEVGAEARRAAEERVRP